MLYITNHGNVEVTVDIFEGSHFVNEQTSFTIRTEILLMELFAIFGFVFVILGGIFEHELDISMSKLAFRSIPALTLFDPIFTHLCLVLCLVDLKHSLTLVN